MSELRALSTAQDRLDQYAAHRFGINRTDLRALDLIGQAGITSPTALAAALGHVNRRHQHRARPRLEAQATPIVNPTPPPQRTIVRVSPRTEELGAAIFAPVIRGTIAQAAALPDAALVVVAEFLAAHRALLNDYLDTAPAAGEG